MARDGDFGRLESILNNLSPEAGVLQVNKLDVCKRAPLHYAARYNHLCVTELLLQKGAGKYEFYESFTHKILLQYTSMYVHISLHRHVHTLV